MYVLLKFQILNDIINKIKVKDGDTMIYMCFKDIKRYKNKRLLDYLKDKCDSFTFMFPKYHCLAVTEDKVK